MPETLNTPTGRTCDCGSPAVKKKGVAWICPRCDSIERRMNADGGSQGQQMREGPRKLKAAVK
jgi:hypothetical protein